MAESTSKTPGPFDPEALLAAQRRNVEAFTSAGKIVADGMRTYAESQVGMMQEAMRNLWGAIQTGGGAPASHGPVGSARAHARGLRPGPGAGPRADPAPPQGAERHPGGAERCRRRQRAGARRRGPNFAEMQKTVTEAMQNASRQVTAAIEEMRKRMTDLQEETRQAMGTARGAWRSRRPSRRWRTSRPPARRIHWRALIRR